MGEIFKALRYGHELRQATGLKWVQALTILVALAYWTAKSFGFDLGWTEDQLFNVVSLAAGVLSLFATFATSRRIGFGRRPPPYYDDPYNYRPSGIPRQYMPGNDGTSFPDGPFLNGDY